MFEVVWNYNQTIIAHSLNKYNDHISAEYTVALCVFMKKQSLLIDLFVNGLLHKGSIGETLNQYR